jgi:hypothetical protein
MDRTPLLELLMARLLRIERLPRGDPASDPTPATVKAETLGCLGVVFAERT